MSQQLLSNYMHTHVPLICSSPLTMSMNSRRRPPLLLLYVVFASAVAAQENDFYIVFLRDGASSERLLETHLNVLSSLKGSVNEASESLVYSYTKSFNAFAAKLSRDEATKLSNMEEVVSILPNRYHKLHTTKSWEFVGLTPNSRRNSKVESNIIVGLLDTGITPDSDSFKDDGLGPPPAKWKGCCAHSANFSGCNNKLIGAKYFKLDKRPDPDDIMSPLDTDGHGTHTSSTLAGVPVPNANLGGLARGTARGAVPRARVAMYKVCWASSGCADMDILAAFESAICDGVDVISISIGGVTGSYTSDSIAVGSFHAMRKGILTVASAGNDGPNHGSVANHAPWLLTVGASGMDRQFRSNVVLGNGLTLSGVGISTFEPRQKLYPLASGIDTAKSSDTREESRYCLENSMDPNKVKGKLVYCKLGSWGADSVVKSLGGVGTFIESDAFLDAAQIFMAPATMVNSSAGKRINDYIHSTTTPSAVIHRSEEIKIPAPFVASFSSRGPNPGTQHLLKPDITAPGIDILASYTLLKSLTGLKGDTQYSKFTFMSGTSMACPHVAGVAAYVKSFHPNWSPAAIRSAIMTTAKLMSSRVDKDAEFAYGAGQVNPTRAISPGLVYDMDDMSYIQFLCREGYNGTGIGSLVGQGPINCSKLVPVSGEDAINYPSMQLALKSQQEPTVGVFRRTVVNVGAPRSVYNATIRAPAGVEIVVSPATLTFSKALQRRSFKVVVKAKPMPDRVLVLSGSLIWRSSRYTVRSPIAVYNPWAN
ncbi:subtilisin-like protease SBT4.14 [Salvia miltiorrhiza]|uniref:subtilisin-like protease SBT4.14 n=1 Tax=Salvia miltiorrhiza TaxID=226208 RepID=UPI0025AB9E80|nr:subtilisin-like protease SBT4.14 [Salvia miltiorrhiza]